MVLARCHGLALCSLLAAVASGEAEQVSPQLHPRQDQRFFGEDYPADARPNPVHDFGHPYPTLQDTDEYDRDFVKDENNEKGQATTQWQYDELRNKLARERRELAAAKAKLDKEKAEYERLVAKEKEAEARSEELEKQAEQASGDSEDGGKYEHPSGNAVTAAGDKVQEEVHELKDCEEELAAAQKKLREFLAELAEAEAVAKQAADEADAAADKAEEAERAEAAQEQETALAEKALKSSEAALKAAQDELKSLEDKLDRAAQRLHAVRRKQAGHDGAIRHREDSESNEAAPPNSDSVGGPDSADGFAIRSFAAPHARLPAALVLTTAAAVAIFA